MKKIIGILGLLLCFLALRNLSVFDVRAGALRIKLLRHLFDFLFGFGIEL